MANAFDTGVDRPIRDEYVSQHVDLPFGQIQKMMDRKTLGYEKGLAQEEANENFLNVQALQADKGLRDDLVNGYNEEMANVVDNAQGDYGAAAAQLRVMGRSIKRDLNQGQLGAIGGSYKAYVGYATEIGDALKKGDISKDRHDLLQGMSLQRYKGVQAELQPGGTYNTFAGETAAKEIQVDALVNDLMKDFKPDEHLEGHWKNNGDGWMKYTENGMTAITEKDIAAYLGPALANETELMSSLKQGGLLRNFQAGDNAQVQAGVDKYVNDSINGATSRAMNKFGFTKEVNKDNIKIDDYAKAEYTKGLATNPAQIGFRTLVSGTLPKVKNLDDFRKMKDEIAPQALSDSYNSAIRAFYKNSGFELEAQKTAMEGAYRTKAIEDLGMDQATYAKNEVLAKRLKTNFFPSLDKDYALMQNAREALERVDERTKEMFREDLTFGKVETPSVMVEGVAQSAPTGLSPSVQRELGRNIQGAINNRNFYNDLDEDAVRQAEEASGFSKDIKKFRAQVGKNNASLVGDGSHFLTSTKGTKQEYTASETNDYEVALRKASSFDRGFLSNDNGTTGRFNGWKVSQTPSTYKAGYGGYGAFSKQWSVYQVEDPEGRKFKVYGGNQTDEAFKTITNDRQQRQSDARTNATYKNTVNSVLQKQIQWQDTNMAYNNFGILQTPEGNYNTITVTNEIDAALVRSQGSRTINAIHKAGGQIENIKWHVDGDLSEDGASLTQITMNAKGVKPGSKEATKLMDNASLSDFSYKYVSPPGGAGAQLYINAAINMNDGTSPKYITANMSQISTDLNTLEGAYLPWRASLYLKSVQPGSPIYDPITAKPIGQKLEGGKFVFPNTEGKPITITEGEAINSMSKYF